MGRDIIQPTVDTIPYVIQGRESTGEWTRREKSRKGKQRKKKGEGRSKKNVVKTFP